MILPYLDRLAAHVWQGGRPFSEGEIKIVVNTRINFYDDLVSIVGNGLLKERLAGSHLSSITIQQDPVSLGGSRPSGG